MIYNILQNRILAGLGVVGVKHRKIRGYSLFFCPLRQFSGESKNLLQLSHFTSTILANSPQAYVTGCNRKSEKTKSVTICHKPLQSVTLFCYTLLHFLLIDNQYIKEIKRGL